MQGFLLSLGLLASSAVSFVAAADLKIDVTQEVECDRKSKNGDKLTMHYRGTLQSSGDQFDASYDRGTPFSFKIGSGQVIKGTLTIPPELGYGPRGMGPIPGGSTLVFETELVGIDGVPKPEKIVIKASEAASEAVESATEGVAEKVASKVAEAADVVKTIVADSDSDGQEHNEL
ncbi:FKBP-type peptidyl-prolyl cis-trans isomerase [Colletotrichum tofieldiae]|uniref:peptidylprolyl isomerase n=1 Tax=Colletotrichum liriopes TaxID=708192 RepID=A0AA37GQ33_9PEZI|nr:FK506-binding protein 2 [Colletotrichum liriopes]GKT65039.1 FKBP-type peptidyl-prolyl cis-trans isomerase [Colletotrichum tofieldiae]GKT75006.1 FKBP-type peptidyl-prolyl cis-trans isomerase [Colletotrichum tofieldiae]GKT92224.1 FKBP-type peptidyl-prolyl cis-trans isomerase [Colletotrichum tofieldiae]